MPGPRHYPNPPITEALIDLRVELPQDTTVARLEAVHVGLEADYPTKKNRNVAEMHWSVSEGTTSSAASPKRVGFLFISSDQKQVLQARLDGFTLSRLAPYDRWEPLRDEARRLWDMYRAVAKPTKIARVALRYINRLDLPLPVRDLKEYLRTVPEVSSDLPQDLAGYFMQLRIPLTDIKAVLLLSQAIIEPARPTVASVALDIDVFRADDLPTDEQGVWDFLEELRIRKNDVFEACITDKAREFFR